MYRYSLTGKTLMRLMAASLFVSVLITSFEIFQQRAQAIERAHTQAISVVQASMAALTVVTWNYDVDGARAVLDGLTHNSAIVQAEVQGVELTVQARAKGVTGKPDLVWSLPIMAPNLNRQIATLQVSESYEGERQRFAAQLGQLMLTELLKSALLVVLLFLIVYRTITRHLIALAQGVVRLTPNAPDETVGLARRTPRHADELDDLVSGINRFHQQRAQEIQRREAVESHLEQLVVERTQALRAALQQADAANQSKSVFLSNMSHELRTPLNAVIGFSRLMSKAGTLNEHDQGSVEIINRSGNHLLTLINDVLELSKIEAGHVQLQEEVCDLGLLVQDVHDMLRARAEQAGLTLVLQARDLPAKGVRVDSTKLRQVLINLMGNAIKFTREGGVTLRVQGHSADALRMGIDFEVSDTGIGIALEDQDNIFKPFVQMVTHATAAGTGLGLTITKQYLQMLGGELVLVSTPGKGSTFRFTLFLPLADLQPATVPVGEVLGLAPADRHKRILIVEDDADSRQLLNQLLLPLGFVLASAVDGLEAVAQAASFAPDLIIMDWRMPRLNGLEATRQIRAQAGSRAPKVVMLTASAFEEQRQEAMAAGISDFLRKPLQEEDLYAALETQLGLQFQRRSPLADASMPQDGFTVCAAAIAELPEALRADLHQAAEELNPEKLQDVLARIEPDHPALALGIANMAKKFLYQELWEFSQAPS
jgi:signal transduction histidine kinase/DNA-binding response OmpR family regulator